MFLLPFSSQMVNLEPAVDASLNASDAAESGLLLDPLRVYSKYAS